MSIRREEFFEELISALQFAAKDRSILRALLFDLLTPAERQEISARLQIVERLNAGVIQEKISEDLKVGLSTVTRGSRTLHNPKGGFNQILEKQSAWRSSTSQRASSA